MSSLARWLAALVLLLCGSPALAHEGPPFPILVDRPAGPYVASVWTDPDIGTGIFFVILEAPEGRALPARTRVRIGVQPLFEKREEALYEAAPQAVRHGARYYAEVPLDQGGMWRVRVLLDGPEGGGELAAEVEATPDGTIGPVALVVYLIPFLAVGFLWLKSALRRRARGSPASPGGAACLLFVPVAALLGQGALAPDVPLPAMARDLAALGIATTGGAAPGYVEDRACGLCHDALFAAYQGKGMARAFRRPRPELDIEDFAAPPLFHAASREYLQIVRDGERLVFRRWQVDGTGQPIHLFTRQVDWILGSGDHARTYLYRTPGGELYQLPLAWYSQVGAWGMAPGFDRPDHEGVSRRVRRECMFCHNAYPDVPAGSDLREAPQEYPAELPEGLGCQRCHGPGAEHVWLALGAIGSGEQIRASVFNPGRLPAARRDEVCLGCHLQPSVALPGLRRFGRGDYSYRPGEPLSAYLVQVDVDEEGRAAGDRFEINHHPYRLRQSRCFLESDGALGCRTCHDPHRPIPPAERIAHYRAACLTCHRPDDCAGEPAHGGGGEGNCAGCHMPKRRTQDVVSVLMTDHRIERRPGGPELLAPLAERDPVLVGVRLLGEGMPAGALGEVYRAAAVVRAGGGDTAVGHLEKMLAAARPAEPEPYLDLAQAQLRQRRFADAAATLEGVLARQPGHPLAQERLALARAGEGRTDEAIALLRRPLAPGVRRIEAEYNLGRLLAFQGRHEEAEAHLERAVEWRPNLVAGWFNLGEVRAARGRPAEAADCYRRALEVDPTHTGSYLALGRLLFARGDRREALRYLRHGATAAARPDLVAAALAEAERPSNQE